MTKAEVYRRSLARHIWGFPDACGWTIRLKDGHVEQDQYGLIRITEAGRKALDLPPIG